MLKLPDYRHRIMFLFIGIIGMPSMLDAKTVTGPSAVQTVAAEADAFALDLYGRLAPAPGNVFFSPYSISTALAMTYGGARGNTARQMANVLHFSLPPDQLHAAFGQLISDLDSGAADQAAVRCELAVANAVWGQKGYPYQPAYLELLQKTYRAGLEQVDFLHASDAARLKVNDWVAGRTHDKIKDLLAPGTVGADTRLVLVNAIYFKAAWAEPFRKELTQDQPFHLQGGQSVTVPLMHQQHRFGYAETDELQAVELAYLGGKLSMVVLLPRKADGLPALEKQLKPDALDQWLGGLGARQVQLYLPKFTMTRQFALAKTLAAIGMPDAFGPRADFSGIAGAEPLEISEVIHKAFVDVNEAGTEAAAATATGMRAGAARVSAPPAVFRADHPFLFLIRDRESKAILFLGRVANPKD